MDEDLAVRADKIESLLMDPAFKRLERDFSESNLFDIIGLAEDERTHSRILAWLLSPGETHGLGFGFIQRFLAEAARIAKARDLSLDYGQRMDPLFVETLSFLDVTIQPEYTMPNSRRPDIVVWSDRDGWLCVLENKIRAFEGPDQTNDYYLRSKEPPLRKYHRRLFIYLSPTGAAAICQGFVPVRYRVVLDVLRSIPREAYSELGCVVVNQYIKCLEDKIMEKDKFQTTCKEIYRKHRRAIDALITYGSTSLLAARIRERVLDRLKAIEGGKGEEWAWSSGSSWIALWPKSWPTRRGYYPAYYGIWATNNTSHFDEVQIGLGFDGLEGSSIRNLLEANKHVPGLTTITAREVSEVDERTEEGASAMIELIKRTFDLVGPVVKSARGIDVPTSQKNSE